MAAVGIGDNGVQFVPVFAVANRINKYRGKMKNIGKEGLDRKSVV